MRLPSFGVRLRSLALACAFAAVASSSASAQYQTGPIWEITAFNGYYIASDLYTTIPGSGTGVGEANIGLENSYMYGARLGVTPNPRFTLEFVYTRIGSDVKINNATAGYNPQTVGKLNGDSFDVDFLFLQPTASARAAGYFTLGFGWTITDPQLAAPVNPIPPGSAGAPESNSLFAWNFGLGAKIDLSDLLALRLEGRWRVTDTAITTSSGVYCDYWGYCYGYSSDWYNSGELTAGLTIKLGGGR